MARLIVTRGPNVGDSYVLGKRIVTIGRDEGCAVRLDREGISRNHAQICNEDGAWTVTDLNSTNGTEVNGTRVEEHKLRSGDSVLIHDVQFKFDAQAAPKGRPAKPAKGASRALTENDLEIIERLRKGRDAVLAEVRKVIIGQEAVIEQLIIALFCGGHGLIVGVPGLAKTLMVRTVASVLDLDFKRIQFTPDLMPSDITGTEILEEDPSSHERYFKFLKGPIFTNVLLADEINRTPPKTQAALLEAMQEHRVTAGGTTHILKLPFFVLATQNPIEQEGTYPLPEAQLDRFMFNILISYPKRSEEVEIVLATTKTQTAELKSVLSGEDVLRLQEIVRRVPVSQHIALYATDIARMTRPRTEGVPAFVNEYLAWGAGPRAAQFLVLGAKARAILAGRVNVTCDDVRAMAPPVLRHRIFTNFNADSEGITVEEIIARLLKTVPEPGEKDYS
jgi:MoxR-like ATPase